MAYADPLAYERQRCAELDAEASTRELTARREFIRQEHIARHFADQAAYRNGPVARRIRFARVLKTMRALRQAFRDGQAAGRDLVMEPVHRDGPSLGQRVRKKAREAFARVIRAGRSRGGNGQRQRAQEQVKKKEPPQRTKSGGGPRVRQNQQQQTRQTVRTKKRSRGQRTR